MVRRIPADRDAKAPEGVRVPRRPAPRLGPDEVERARQAALDQIRAAALGEPGPEGLPRAALLDELDPHDLARLLLAALGRGDHGDRDTNPVYALYQVALDYRTAAEGYRTLAAPADAADDPPGA